MALKLRVLTKFPALVEAATGLAVSIANGVYTFTLDLLSIDTVDSIADLSTRYIMLVSGTSSADAVYERMSLDDFIAATAGVLQVVDSSGSHDVDVATSLLIVNPTVAGDVTLNMPPSATKIGDITITDWANNAGTNNITIACNGTEKMNGLSQDWLIASDGGAVKLSPYSDQGYAVK